jgi:hypothetical protein
MAADLSEKSHVHAAAQRACLLAHPDAAREFVRSIVAELHFTPGATLACRYTLSGDMTRLQVPPEGGGRRADGLWRHTCFEAFVSAPDTAGYHEFNFSPALDWAAYRFTDYRTGMSAATLERAPGLHVRRSSDALELVATVHLGGLATLSDARALRVALAAVIEDNDGRLAYWALRHASGKPDFHHPEGFTLELRPA